LSTAKTHAKTCFVDLQVEDYKEILLAKFETRRVSEPNYSLRRFAQAIGLTPSNLSDIFKGRCGLSLEGAIRVAEALQLNENERQDFLDLVESQHARSQADRAAAKRRLDERRKRPFQNAAAEISAIEHWYYLAALELVELTNGQIDEQSLSERLSINREQARDAFVALLNLRLIKLENGRYVRLKNEFAVAAPTPSHRIQNYHRQMLQLAEGSLTRQPLKRRQFSSTVMTFDSKRIDEAKEFLAQVEDEFFRRFEAKDGADCVYALNLQLFGVDRQAGDQS